MWALLVLYALAEGRVSVEDRISAARARQTNVKAAISPSPAPKTKRNNAYVSRMPTKAKAPPAFEEVLVERRFRHARERSQSFAPAPRTDAPVPRATSRADDDFAAADAIPEPATVAAPAAERSSRLDPTHRKEASVRLYRGEPPEAPPRRNVYVSKPRADDEFSAAEAAVADDGAPAADDDDAAADDVAAVAADAAVAHDSAAVAEDSTPAADGGVVANDGAAAAEPGAAISEPRAAAADDAFAADDGPADDGALATNDGAVAAESSAVAPDYDAFATNDGAAAAYYSDAAADDVAAAIDTSAAAADVRAADREPAAAPAAATMLDDALTDLGDEPIMLNQLLRELFAGIVEQPSETDGVDVPPSEFLAPEEEAWEAAEDGDRRDGAVSHDEGLDAPASSESVPAAAVPEDDDQDAVSSSTDAEPSEDETTRGGWPEVPRGGDDTFDNDTFDADFGAASYGATPDAAPQPTAVDVVEAAAEVKVAQPAAAANVEAPANVKAPAAEANVEASAKLGVWVWWAAVLVLGALSLPRRWAEPRGRAATPQKAVRAELVASPVFAVAACSTHATAKTPAKTPARREPPASARVSPDESDTAPCSPDGSDATAPCSPGDASFVAAPMPARGRPAAAGGSDSPAMRRWMIDAASPSVVSPASSAGRPELEGGPELECEIDDDRATHADDDEVSIDETEATSASFEAASVDDEAEAMSAEATSAGALFDDAAEATSAEVTSAESAEATSSAAETSVDATPSAADLSVDATPSAAAASSTATCLDAASRAADEDAAAAAAAEHQPAETAASVETAAAALVAMRDCGGAAPVESGDGAVLEQRQTSGAPACFEAGSAGGPQRSWTSSAATTALTLLLIGTAAIDVTLLVHRGMTRSAPAHRPSGAHGRMPRKLLLWQQWQPHAPTESHGAVQLKVAQAKAPVAQRAPVVFKALCSAALKFLRARDFIRNLLRRLNPFARRT
ncbi:hypothetical protein M885DRAFT_610687 [Pelagophyceae sp. CCMP2097]|nr:hypothetical protein M885DRAFT_610687 [Pelagophyceae sp. CCMP2097]